MSWAWAWAYGCCSRSNKATFYFGNRVRRKWRAVPGKPQKQFYSGRATVPMATDGGGWRQEQRRGVARGASPLRPFAPLAWGAVAASHCCAFWFQCGLLKKHQRGTEYGHGFSEFWLKSERLRTHNDDRPNGKRPPDLPIALRSFRTEENVNVLW